MSGRTSHRRLPAHTRTWLRTSMPPLGKTVHDSGIPDDHVEAIHDGFRDGTRRRLTTISSSSPTTAPDEGASTECNKLASSSPSTSRSSTGRSRPRALRQRQSIDENLMTTVIKPPAELDQLRPDRRRAVVHGRPTAEQSQRMAQWVHELQPETMVKLPRVEQSGDSLRSI